jgi:hypothetical protein
MASEIRWRLAAFFGRLVSRTLTALAGRPFEVVDWWPQQDRFDAFIGGDVDEAHATELDRMAAECERLERERDIANAQAARLAERLAALTP